MDNSTAIEEWKLLQSIIARQEGLVFTIRGCHIAFITALSVGAFTGRIAVNGLSLAMIGIGVLLAFLWMELAQRVPLKRSIERSKAVEESMRNGNYQGPWLADSLTKPVTSIELWRPLFLNEMIYIPALAIFFVILVMAAIV